MFIKKSYLSSLMLLIVGISFALGFGYYKNAVAKEQAAATVAINGESIAATQSIVFDIADQGMPKKWLQPNQILIASYLIKNESKNPLAIQVEAVDFVKQVVLEVGSPDIKKPSAIYMGTVESGKTLRVKVKMDLADQHFSQTKQQIGVLQIVDIQTGALLGNTSVYAMNSSQSLDQDQKSVTPSTVHETHESHGSHEEK
ncbi:hypothetical protein [Pelosinus propionicus]|uniref:Uncharacterized protein n=1 Tax=Pelosinus propionicus DSM 13327 TaxID=1123291 RepID=A0A1I4GQP3_9FIRM|nr:hypothetical protein [Pelosinus propionicus]SFL31436.1 hypothetical protein SAMN04490355_100162 [Pelosinus propionicus DSM 13327]